MPRGRRGLDRAPEETGGAQNVERERKDKRYKLSVGVLSFYGGLRVSGVKPKPAEPARDVHQD